MKKDVMAWFLSILILFSGGVYSHLFAATPSRQDLPHIPLTANILYQFVAADLAYFTSNHVTAYKTLSDLAEKTGDPRVARKALEYTIETNSLALLADAAINWQKFDRYSLDALQTYYKVQSLIINTPEVGKNIGEFFNNVGRDPADSIKRIESISFFFENSKKRLEFLEAALKSFRPNVLAELAIIKAQFHAKETDVAQKALQNLLQSTPNHPDILLTTLHLQNDQLPELFHSQMRTFLEESKEPSDLIDAWIDFLFNTKKYDQVALIVNRLQTIDPSHYKLLYYASKLALVDKKGAQALMLIQQAQTQLLQALEENTITPLAYQDASDRFVFFNSLILEQTGNIQDARKILQDYHWTYNKISAAQRIAFLMIAEKKNLKTVIQYLDGIPALSPLEETEIAEIKVAIYQNQQQGQQALQVLEQLIKKYPENINLQYTAGILAAELKSYDRSIKYFRQVVKESPNFAQGLNALGYTLLEAKKNTQEAYDLIRKAYDLQPNDAAITDSLGWAYFVLGDYVQAEHYLGIAYQLNTRPEIALHYAEALWKQNKKEELKALFQTLKEEQKLTTEIKNFMKRIGY